jgi:hypothetical protein
MAPLMNLPTRQAPRPGSGDERHARAYDSASGGWTLPVAALPSDEGGDGTCGICGLTPCRCGRP